MILMISSSFTTSPFPVTVQDVASIVTLGNYKGLEYTIVDTSVSDDEVQDYIDNTLSTYDKPEQLKEGEVKDGDTVNVDFEGKVDGETFFVRAGDVIGRIAVFLFVLLLLAAIVRKR